MKKIKIIGPEKVTEPVKKMIKEIEDQVNSMGVEIKTVSLSPYYNDRENRVEFFAAVTYEGEIKVDPIVEPDVDLDNLDSEPETIKNETEIETIPETEPEPVKKDKKKKNKKGKK